MIAFQLAVDHPELVKSLVIVNAGSEVVARTLKEHWQVFFRFSIAYLLKMQRMGEVLSRRLFPDDDQVDLRELFVERWAENDKRAYLDTLRAIVGWSVTDQVHKVNLPTLVVTTEKDYTPVSAKESFVRKMPRAELVVIPNSRHATPVDNPEKFNEAVLAFLAKV